MLEQMLDRDFITAGASMLAEALGRSNMSAAGRNDSDPAPDEIADAHAAVVAALGRITATTTSKIDKRAFISGDPVLALVQSVLTAFFEERHPAYVQPIQGGQHPGVAGNAVTDRRLDLSALGTPELSRWLDAFGASEIDWAARLTATAWAKQRRNRPFNDQPALPAKISNHARVVLVGDWASGLPRARKVANAIRAELAAAADRDRHVIHLGDTYYSGWPREYLTGFLPYWPVRQQETSSIGSWSLNANHDMYSGGYGYFDTLLADPRFVRQHRSSLFSLENDHWQLLGLDTAYADHDLYGHQAKWAKACRDAAPSKKGIMLSHHQPFGAFGYDDGEALRQKLGPLLSAGQAKAWFWGHEHRCALYAPHHGIAYPRCIGHGGIPVYAAEAQPPSGVHYVYREAYKEGSENWAFFGFAVLDFDEAAISVRYINENGVTHQQEVLR